MIPRVLTILLLTCAASAASAQSVLYECDMTQLKRGKGWISEKIAIVLHENGTASVSDSMVLRVSSVPIAAESVRNTDKKLTVKWVIRNYTNSSNQTTPYFDYEATIRKNGKISVYASPDGFPDRFSGTGTCAKRTS